jgi:hypothetical protein
MYKKSFFVVFLTTMLVFSSDAFALSSMKSMFGKGGSNAAAGSTDQLLNSFINAQVRVMVAQERLSVAYGMKEQSDLLQLQIQSLSSSALDSSKNDSDKKQGSAKINLDDVKKSIEISNSTQAQIDQYIEQDMQLNPESKKAYSEGVAAYVLAVKDAYVFVQQVNSFASNTGPMGILDKVKGAKTVIFITKSSPSYFKNFFDSTKKVFTYAKKQKIEVPKDATAMLDG